MTRTEKLIDTIARLNPEAGEIGAGMLANIVAEAKAIQQNLPDSEQLELWRSTADDLLNMTKFNAFNVRKAALQLQNAYLSWTN